jgi:hypothetical protein
MILAEPGLEDLSRRLEVTSGFLEPAKCPIHQAEVRVDLADVEMVGLECSARQVGGAENLGACIRVILIMRQDAEPLQLAERNSGTRSIGAVSASHVGIEPLG